MLRKSCVSLSPRNFAKRGIYLILFYIRIVTIKLENLKFWEYPKYEYSIIYIFLYFYIYISISYIYFSIFLYFSLYLLAEVKMPSGNMDKPVIEDNHDGTVSIRYDPREEGQHELSVKFNGEHVQGLCEYNGCNKMCRWVKKLNFVSSYNCRSFDFSIIYSSSIIRFTVQIPRGLFGERIRDCVRARFNIRRMRRAGKLQHLHQRRWSRWPFVIGGRTQQSWDLLPRQQGWNNLGLLSTNRSRRIQNRREIRRQTHSGQPLRCQNHRYAIHFSSRSSEKSSNERKKNTHKISVSWSFLGWKRN